MHQGTKVLFLVLWTRPALKYANYMVPGSFSCLNLVHLTRPTIKYANFMDVGSFSRFILVQLTIPTKIYTYYMVPGSFYYPLILVHWDSSNYKIG